jgi:tetratricopeptide (TPR) repeat protein
MEAIIEQRGEDVLCRMATSSVPELRVDGTQALTCLQAWAGRYNTAVRNNDDLELADIGHEMLSWMDVNGWASEWTKSLQGSRVLRIRVDSPEEPLGQALLDAPWELLADDRGFFADDEAQWFDVARRIGKAGEPAPPKYSDLHVLFMAAAPEGATVLDFEAEETAIVQATQNLRMQLVVEESGSAPLLTERIAADGPFEALHISCHGDIDSARGPYLLLEDAAGERAEAFVADMVRCLGDVEQRPPLVFLSACRTAEQQARSGESFVRALVRSGVANVLGWDGSVYDRDAAAFAESFYKALALGRSVTHAAAEARRQLRTTLTTNPQRGGQHWHLARLYLGVRGGGAVVAKGKPKRTLAGAKYQDQFLDPARSEVPVATRAEFVGRRRQIQAVLKAFRTDSHGVLIHGMGNGGKSSMAARIASRLTGHRTVVVFKNYDAVTVLDRVLGAVSANDRPGFRATWRDQVHEDAGLLAEALEDLLTGPLHEHPILLIIDDLERILEAPAPTDPGATPMRADYRATYLGVLGAFASADTDSRVLFTSRYLFMLSDAHGRDVAARLHRVPLPPMKLSEQRKQWLAKVRTLDTSKQQQIDRKLAARALDVAEGNPGLLSALAVPILHGESAAAEAALAAIEHFRVHGVPPQAIRDLLDHGVAQDESNAMVAFFKRMAFSKYRAALSESQAQLLSAACLFTNRVAVPRPAVEAAGSAAGVANAAVALDRLMGLGLVDDYGSIANVSHVAVNPHARPLVLMDPRHLSGLMSAAVDAFALCLQQQDGDGEFRADARVAELARLAILSSPVNVAVLNNAVAVAARRQLHLGHDARRTMDVMLQPALLRLDTEGRAPSSEFAQVLFDCAELLGRTEIKQRALVLLSSAATQGVKRGNVLLRLAKEAARTSPIDAETLYLQAAAILKTAGRQSDWAIAMDGVAGSLQARGKLDEALRILKGEVLIAFEQLNAVREKAIVQGRIADILFTRGELDEALRIHVEVELPLYMRLSDARSKATTQGKIANILRMRGQSEKALQILKNEVLPAVERLDDVRSKAVTHGRIADILQLRGELEEALRIRVEEELPVYDRLHDAREKARSQGKIAEILRARGRLDEALQILKEEALPVYERLGDVHGKAVTQGRIADILQARGELEEALLLREACLATFQQLGDVEGIAHTKYSIAAIRLQQPDALSKNLQQIFTNLHESFGIVIQLQRADAVGHVGQLLAQVMAMGGLRDEALQVLDLVEAAFEKLGDVAGLEGAKRLRDMIKEQGATGGEATAI